MLAQAIEPVFAFPAAALSAAGAFALFESWRRRGGAHRRIMVAGWALFAASLPAWIAASGPDRGAAIACLAAMTAAAAILLLQYLRPDGPVRRAPSRLSADAALPVGLTPVLRTLWSGVLAVPVALAAAMFLCALVYALVLGLGFPQPDALFWSIFVAPFAWGALAVVAAADYRLRTRTAALLAAVVATGVPLALLLAL